MRSRLNSSFTKVLMSAALGLAGAAALTSAAFAGADDGGSKAFYDNPGPGLYQQGPGESAQPAAQSPNPSIQGNGPTATMENGAYQGYRDQPVEPAVRPHKHMIRKHHTPAE